MGIKQFAKQMFKADFRKNRFFIFIVSVITIIVVNAVNVSYHKEIYDTTGESILISGIPQGMGNTLPAPTYEMPVELIQKQGLLILFTVAFFFLIVCNSNFLKTKAKEIAFVTSNGGSIIDLVRYLSYIIGKSYIIGMGIGYLVGIILIPIFNLIMFALVGRYGQIFLVSFMGLGISALFLFLLFAFLMMVSVGYIYRKEPIELMKIDNLKNYEDKRAIKIPGVIFFFIYIISLYINIRFISVEGGDKGAYAIGFLAIIGIYGTIKYYIPALVKRIKKMRFMYTGMKSIYASNFQKTISNSLVYILVLYACTHYLTNLIVSYSDSPYIVNFIIFAIIGNCIIIFLSLIYNLMIEGEDKMKVFEQMKILGYKRDEILEVSNKEYILYFFIGLGLPLIQLIVMFIIYYSLGTYTLSLVCKIIAGILAPIVIILIAIIKREKNLIQIKLYS